MKILFINPSLEEQMRGIGVILDSLIEAAHSQGHEIGLLVGHPSKQYRKSAAISEKLLHTNLQHYLREGKDSFAHFVKGGYRRRNLPRLLLATEGFRSQEIKIIPKYLAGSLPFLKKLDFVIRVPFFYRLLIRNQKPMVRSIVRKIVRKHKIDLVICASPSIIRSQDLGRRAKLAHFIHDVMPMELVETPPNDNGPYKFAVAFQATVNNSDLLLTNSQDTAQKVKEINPKANVQVLYGTASNKGARMAETAILEKHHLRPKNYLLFISVLERRKNLENLFEAYTLFADRIKLPLVLVGGQGYGWPDIKAKYEALPGKIKSKVIFTGFVSEADKYTLLKHAKLFVFPSFYEGFGLIIVEAMMNRLPVVTSRRGALPESGGKAAVYIDNPYDPYEIGQAILKVLNNPVKQKQMIKSGIKEVTKYTQAQFNQRFAKALKSLGSR